MTPRRFLRLMPNLAHQGGWDEALLIFGLPVVLFVIMRIIAGRRRPDSSDDGRDG